MSDVLISVNTGTPIIRVGGWGGGVLGADGLSTAGLAAVVTGAKTIGESNLGLSGISGAVLELAATLTSSRTLTLPDQDVTISSYGASLIDDADAATARSTLGLGTIATQNTINNDDWNGADLEVENGGTGASSASAARTNLGLGTIATQDANSIDIDGGSIDGTTIGGSSAAAGTFTTIAAIGDIATGGDLTRLNGDIIAGYNSGLGRYEYADGNLTITPIGVTNSKLDGTLLIDGGTLTDPQTGLLVTQTWNDAADTFSAFAVGVTDTASASASSVMSLSVDGSDIFDVRKNGNVTITPELNNDSPPSYGLTIDLGDQVNTNTQASGLKITGSLSLNDEDTEFLVIDSTLSGSDVDEYGRDLNAILVHCDTTGITPTPGTDSDVFFVRHGGQVAMSSCPDCSAELPEENTAISWITQGIDIEPATDQVDPASATHYHRVNGTTVGFGGGLVFASNAPTSYRAGIFWRRTGGGDGDGAIMLAAGDQSDPGNTLDVGLEVHGTDMLTRVPAAFDMRVESTAASTDTITGALVVAGGVGIGGALNVGDNLSVDGDSYFNGAQTVAFQSSTISTASDLVLTKTVTAVEITDASGAGNLQLWASPVSGDMVAIRNNDGSSNSFDVESNGGSSTILTLADGESRTFIHNGTTWIAF